MRIVEGFCVRHVLNETIAVPTGQAARHISGIVALNEVGEFLFELLQTDQTPASLAQAVTEAYDVTYSQASEDVAEFLDIFRTAGLLIEEAGSGKEG